MTTTHLYDMNDPMLSGESSFSARDTVRATTCELCEGTGQVLTACLNIPGSVLKVCPNCNGKGTRTWVSAPRSTVIEAAGWIIIEMEMPGVEAENLDVTVNERTVEIRSINDAMIAATSRNSVAPNGNARPGRIDRRLELPKPLDPSREQAVRATLQDGIFRLVLPVVQPGLVDTSRRISSN